MVFYLNSMVKICAVGGYNEVGKNMSALKYKDTSVILALTISDKKAQQATINQILVDIAEYQKYVYETLRKRDLI